MGGWCLSQVQDMPSTWDPFFQDVFGAQQRAVTTSRVAPVLSSGPGREGHLRLQDGRLPSQFHS
jgi:hypothetical protein